MAIITRGDNNTLATSGVLKLDATDFVYELNPKDTPLFTMLMSKSPRTVGNRKDYQFNIVPALKRTFTIASVTSAVIFDVTDATGLQRGDILEVLPGGSSESGVTFHTQKLVTDVTSAQVTVDTGFGGSLAAGDTVYRTSNASGQGSRSFSAIQPLPVAGTNNAQEFKTAIKIVSDITEGREMTYYDYMAIAKKHASNDFKLNIENALWFGAKSSSLKDARLNYIYTAKGFYTALVGSGMQIVNEKGTDYQSMLDLAYNGTTFTFEAFHKWATESMIYGSNEKYFFVDTWLDRRIREIHRDTLRTSADDTMLGLEVTKIKAGKGVINMICNPQFDTGATFNGGILVDPNYVKLDMYRTPILEVNLQETDEDADKSQFVGTFGIEYAAPETHGVVTHLLS